MQCARATKPRLTIAPVLTMHALHAKFLRVLLPLKRITCKHPSQIANANQLMAKTHATRCTEDNSQQDSMEQLAHHRVEKVEKEAKVVKVQNLAPPTLLLPDLLF